MTPDQAREIRRLADVGLDLVILAGTREGFHEAGVHAQAVAVEAVLGHRTCFAGLSYEDRQVLLEVGP